MKFFVLSERMKNKKKYLCLTDTSTLIPFIAYHNTRPIEQTVTMLIPQMIKVKAWGENIWDLDTPKAKTTSHESY